MKFCPYCGTKMDDDMSFCANCGRESPKQGPKHFEESSLKKSSMNALSPNEKGNAKKKSHALLIAFLCIVVCGALLFCGYYLFYNKPFSENPEQISETSKSVVMLECFDEDGNLYCTGSGFTLLEANIIVTNFHVVSPDVYSITAKMDTGMQFPVEKILAYDEEKDIAILQTSSTTGMKVLNYSERDLEKGENVIAIGSPLGLINTVSTGVFSGYVTDSDFRYIQFTASVSSGSSGGPLFDNEGRVIGITSATLTEGQNINFSIPISYVIELWNNRIVNDAQTISNFAKSFTHVYSVDEVIKKGRDVFLQTITVEGYVSYYYEYNSEKYIGLVSSPKDVLGLVYSKEYLMAQPDYSTSSSTTYFARKLLDFYKESNKQQFNYVSFHADFSSCDPDIFKTNCSVGQFVRISGEVHTAEIKNNLVYYGIYDCSLCS